VLRLGDHEVTAAAADSPGLPEHRRDVVGSSLDAAFGLRDRLLGDDQDIAALEAADALDRIAENRAEVDAGLELGQPLEREDPDLGQRATAAAPQRSRMRGRTSWLKSSRKRRWSFPGPWKTRWVKPRST
jgi:hypothetical protein